MTDRELQQHLLNALDWEPSIEAGEIRVSVHDGIVTLRGNVGSYTEKQAAERVALGVYGVKAVANDLTVRLSDGVTRTDTEIAEAAVNALRWNTSVPKDRVAVAVTNGRVALKGTLEWHYQRDAAERAVRDLVGVRGVTNEIVVHPRVKVADVQHKIEAAFRRSADIDARRVNVNVTDGHVTLTGNVHSWSERDEARRAAWAAPGVTAVEDHIVVVP